MTFREKLVALRARDHLTQTALARAVGVTRQSVYMWEKGQSYPEAETLFAIRRLFGVSIDALLDDAVSLSDLPSPALRQSTQKACNPTPRPTPESEELEPAATEEPPEIAPETERSAKIIEKTPLKTDKKQHVAPKAEEPTPDPRAPLRAKVAPTKTRKSGSILDLLGAFWRKKK